MFETVTMGQTAVDPKSTEDEANLPYLIVFSNLHIHYMCTALFEVVR